MADFNRVILAGRLTDDPRKFESEHSVCFFALAVGHRYRDKVGNKVKDEIHFFDVVCFGSVADSVLKFMFKGSPVIVEGRLQQLRKDNEDGTKTSKISVAASSVIFLPDTKDRANGQG